MKTQIEIEIKKGIIFLTQRFNKRSDIIVLPLDDLKKLIAQSENDGDGNYGKATKQYHQLDDDLRYLYEVFKK